METERWTRCPDCRWTGPTRDLQDAGAEFTCPACGVPVTLQ